MRVDLGPLRQLAGFLGAAVVDTETGLVLGRLNAQGQAFDASAAAAVDVVKAGRAFAAVNGAVTDFEEVVIPLRHQLHFARALRLNPAIVLYLALDRESANLGLAHLTLRNVEAAIQI